MKIPDKLKVGGRTVRIKFVSSYDNNGVSGSYNDWTGTIKLVNDPDLCDTALPVVLIHEILECLNARHEYELPHPVMEGLAEGLFQIIRDNGLDFRGDDA